MDIQKIKKLIELVEESGIEELEISEAGDSVRIRRSSASSVPHLGGVPLSFNVGYPGNLTAPPQQAPAPVQAPVSSVHQFCSPMVGTFYRSAAPGGKPFVEEGTKVNVGDSLCIIEAMKMMNRIEADRTGVVKEILVKNSHPVEFGEALFTIVDA